VQATARIRFEEKIVRCNANGGAPVKGAAASVVVATCACCGPWELLSKLNILSKLRCTEVRASVLLSPASPLDVSDRTATMNRNLSYPPEQLGSHPFSFLEHAKGRLVRFIVKEEGSQVALLLREVFLRNFGDGDEFRP
jgi:hypothetical protein